MADSPLYSPVARYYADHRLDDALRLATVGAPSPAPGPPLVGTPAPGPTVFSRGDPSFHIEWPKPGGSLSGRVEVSVYADQNLGVQYVAVLVDEQFACMANVMPFRVSVDTTIARDGLREIRVDGYGADGTIVKSASALVNIANGQRTLSPVEVTQAVLAHMERWEPHIRATYLLRPEHALAQARPDLVEARGGLTPDEQALLDELGIRKAVHLFVINDIPAEHIGRKLNGYRGQRAATASGVTIIGIGLQHLARFYGLAK